MLRTLSSARHRAKAAAATNRRLLGSGGRESGEGGQGKEEEDGGAAVLRQEAAELEANVCLAAAAYAWEEASAEDWGLLTEGATEGLSAAAVEAEDAAEVVADTVAEVTSELAKAELSPIQVPPTSLAAPLPHGTSLLRFQFPFPHGFSFLPPLQCSPPRSDC